MAFRPSAAAMRGLATAALRVARPAAFSSVLFNKSTGRFMSTMNVDLSQIDDAITFLSDKGVFSDTSNPAYAWDPVMAEQMCKYLRDPSTSRNPVYFEECQMRLLRLFKAAKFHEPEAIEPPPGVHRFSAVEFPGYDQPPLIITKPGVLVQRCQRSSLCYMHAAVMAQYYAIWHNKLRTGETASSHGVVDVGRIIAYTFSPDRLWEHVFGDKGHSSRDLLEFILPAKSIITSSSTSELGKFLEAYGPGLVSLFKVHDDFNATVHHRHHELPSGPMRGRHAMVMLGARTDGSGNRFYLLQNWWPTKQFVEVSESYLEACGPTVYFIKTPQTHVRIGLDQHPAMFHWQEMEADMPEKVMG